MCISPGRVAQSPHRVRQRRDTPLNKGARHLGGLLLVTFLGRSRKVTSRRAAPGSEGNFNLSPLPARHAKAYADAHPSFPPMAHEEKGPLVPRHFCPVRCLGLDRRIRRVRKKGGVGFFLVRGGLCVHLCRVDHARVSQAGSDLAMGRVTVLGAVV